MSILFRLFLGLTLCSSIIACQNSSSDALAGVAGNPNTFPTNVVTDPNCVIPDYAARNPTLCNSVNTGTAGGTCFNPSNCNIVVPDNGCTCGAGETAYYLNNQIVCDRNNSIGGTSTHFSAGFSYSDSDYYGTDKEIWAEIEVVTGNESNSIINNCIDDGFNPRPEAVLCASDNDCRVLGSRSRCEFRDSNNPNIGFCSQ